MPSYKVLEEFVLADLAGLIPFAASRAMKDPRVVQAVSEQLVEEFVPSVLDEFDISEQNARIQLEIVVKNLRVEIKEELSGISEHITFGL